MKSLVRNILALFMLFICTLALQSSSCAENFPTENYITGICKETHYLVSNNLFNESITSYQKENQESSASGEPLVISFESKQNLFLKYQTQEIGSFIHNLSTNKEKVQQIRAP